MNSETNFSNFFFKLTTERDIPSIHQLYLFYIKNSTATWYLDEIGPDEMRVNIPLNHPIYKSFSIFDKNNEKFIGFFYYSSFNKRAGYNRTAEVSIYIDPNYHRRGIGTKALYYIEKILKQGQIKVLIAKISGDNQSSIDLFEKMEYEKCGHLREVGEKFGKILDVVIYQKIFSV